MKSSKDKNVQDKNVEYNSDQLSCLNSKTFFKFVTISAQKLQTFLIHFNKSDFRTFKNRITKQIFFSNINNNGDNNEKLEKQKNGNLDRNIQKHG